MKTGQLIANKIWEFVSSYDYDNNALEKHEHVKTNEIIFRRFLMTLSVNLRNRTGEERRRQTSCDKRDSNFVRINFSPNFTFF